MGILVQHPGLAALPALVFLLLYRLAPRRLILAAAVAWLLYGFYEFGMKLELLCSGECDIRIDLLRIYPALGALSLIAVVTGAWALRRGLGRVDARD